MTMTEIENEIIIIFQNNISHELPKNFPINTDDSINSLGICSMYAAGILLDIEELFDVDLSVLPNWCNGEITIQQIALHILDKHQLSAVC